MFVTKRVFFLIAALSAVSNSSFASIAIEPLYFGFESIPEYQVGDTWSRPKVTPEVMNAQSPWFKQMAQGTAVIGHRATAFYLGKFNGHHMMATNFHVMEGDDCPVDLNFKHLARSYRCNKLYGLWNSIDLALLSFEVRSQDEAIFATLGKNFDFSAVFYPGQELVTMGFGAVGSGLPDGMSFNADRDCKVFSSEFRKMGDPDDFNPGNYEAWSFANGCDAAHGDSGSPFLDRKTGSLVGILWTGRTPKPAYVHSSSTLDQMIREQDPRIWKDLNYGVPAAKIREVLQQYLREAQLTDDEKKTIGEIIK